MSPDQKIIKKAVKRVIARKYFWRHFLVFVLGNVLLFMLSLNSRSAHIFFLLSLTWLRLLAFHFKQTYPEIINDGKLAFREGGEDVAIDREIKRIALHKEMPLELKKEPQRFVLKPLLKRDYEEGDLV